MKLHFTVFRYHLYVYGLSRYRYYSKQIKVNQYKNYETPQRLFYAAVTVLPTYLSIIFIKLPSLSFLSSGNHSPLLIHKIFIRSWYSKFDNNFGVMRKYCPLSAVQVTRTRRLCTARSYRASMPWLISSTSEKGVRASALRLIRYITVVSARSYIISFDIISLRGIDSKQDSPLPTDAAQ